MKILSLLFIIIPFLSAASHITTHDVNESLNRLDMEIKKQPVYLSQHSAHIDSLHSCLVKAVDIDSILDITMQLGDSFTAFNNDSSLVYYTKGYDFAREKGRNVKAIEFRIRRAVNLPLSGFIHDATNEFYDVDKTALPDSLLPFYYESGRQLFSYISSFYSGNESGRYWSRFEREFHDSYMRLNSVNDPFYTINLASQLIISGNRSQAQGLLEDYISNIPHNSNFYARACHILATIAHSKGDNIARTYYLAQSAMADLSAAVLEVTSLQELGKIMYDSGNVNRAYDYLSAALLNSVECHASVRMLETSSALPLIQQAHNEQISKWKSRIYLVIILLCIVLGLMVLGLFYLRHQMKRTSILKDRLQSANQLKDIYISQFFRLSSIYVDKMNQLCKIVNRKISSGQVDELYKITKSNKFVEEQTQDFYRLFDDAFLNMYPGFIEKVNQLLHDKIILKDGEILNNDLRILAFMRLGLEDTNQVAQILNYSVNTIYAYRNKLRNRAIDRDNFERDIMSIPSI